MPANFDNCERMIATPHPAVLLLLWMCLAVAVQALHAPVLLAACGLLAAIALKLSAARFRILLRRTRWIMFSLLLVYGYATPGTALIEAGGIWSPTGEGLADGALQLARLVSALAGLSIVLAMLTQQQLLGGLYALAYPLRYLGVSRERLAVRLALTLRYAEAAMLEVSSGWRDSIARMLEPAEPLQHEVELHTYPFTLRDGLLLAAAFIAVVLL